jgi:predicted RNase H-like nuclease (RuvC/YqgF family)
VSAADTSLAELNSKLQRRDYSREQIKSKLKRIEKLKKYAVGGRKRKFSVSRLFRRKEPANT